MKLRLLNIFILMSSNNDSDQHEKRTKILEIIRFSKCLEILGAVNFYVFLKALQIDLAMFLNIRGQCGIKQSSNIWTVLFK
jgi:hypothetical protein